ncbi:MAG TPA: response regulator [Bryobacteraceae bacterium]|jgi:CheY-like chemotaxis protein
MVRILIVDDRPASRELERLMLESFGYEVMEASSGREAIATALHAIPDLVLLDLYMPELDGFRTLAEFQKQQQLAGVPIVALTASAMKGDDLRVLGAGFSGYITKPVFLHEFRDQIRRFLAQCSAAR